MSKLFKILFVLVSIVCIFSTFFNGYLFTVNNEYGKALKEVSSKDTQKYDALQEQYSTLYSKNKELEKQVEELNNDERYNDLQEQYAGLSEKNKELESQIVAFREIESKVAELELKNSELSDFQKNSEVKIAELFKDKMNFYYPVIGDDKKSEGYLVRLLEGFVPITKYKEGEYDCSEMAAHLEWYLETNGVKAEIVVGKPNWVKTRHAWVWAYVKGGRLAIEATNRVIKYYSGILSVDKSYYDEKNVERVYDSINNIPQNEIEEFDWWNVK